MMLVSRSYSSVGAKQGSQNNEICSIAAAPEQEPGTPRSTNNHNGRITANLAQG
jgi:hypothetical protein